MTALPETIGPYSILEALGRGGMGVVYRAVRQDSGRTVALKTVRAPNEWALSGLRREIHALARLDHPQIVSIVEEGEEEGLPWYAMELLEGTSLRRFATSLFNKSPTRRLFVSEEPTPLMAPVGDPRTGTVHSDTGPSDRPVAGAPTIPATAATNRATGAPTPAPTDPRDAGTRSVASQTVTVRADLIGRESVHGAAAPPRVDREPAAGGSLASVLSIVRRICAPLSFLHGEGIVHRDLKMENVVLKPTPESELGLARQLATPYSELIPVIVDFGLMVQFGGTISREALEVGATTSGTLSTMAPEQIRGELVDARADLYALGCILYELLTGRAPFVGSNRGVVQGHLHDRPTPPSQLVTGVPAGLDALVLHLLAKEPRERVGHADDVAAALIALGADAEWSDAGPKPRPYLYRPALAGRESVLASLDEELARVGSGQGALVLIGGESGVGKTRLAIELARQAERRRMLVVAGESAPLAAASADAATTGGEPLHPLRPLLQSIADRCRERGASETERLLGTRGKVLASYEPALLSLPGQESQPEPLSLPAEQAKRRLFESLADTLAALTNSESQPTPDPTESAERSLLILLDDLQWADDLTLGFLEALLTSGRLDRMPVLILGTYRVEEVGTRTHSRLVALLHDSRCTHMQLGRLDEPALGEMVGDMLGVRPAQPVFVRFLARHSEGNPFFVAEYLRTALAEGLLYRDEAGHWQTADASDATVDETVYEELPLPGSLRELVGRRLDGLSADARDILEAACVLGRDAEPSLIAELTDLEVAREWEGTQELIARMILEEGPPHRARSVLRFAHDKLREVAYDRLDAPRRTALHRSAATALEERVEAGGHAVLGHHWEQAGELTRAREHYLIAARQAAKQYAHREAERLYRACLALYAAPTIESVEARNELGTKVLRTQGRLAEAIVELRVAAQESREVGDPGTLGRNSLSLGAALWEAGDVPNAKTHLEQALATFRSVGDRGREARALGNLALLHTELGHTDEAEAMFEAALEIFEHDQDRMGEGVVLGNLAMLHFRQGSLDKAAELYSRALAIHRQVGNKQFEGITLLNLAILNQQNRELDAAARLYADAVAVSSQIQDRRTLGVTLGNLAELRQDLGQMDEATDLYHQALQIHRQVGSRQLEAMTLQGQSMLGRRCGAFEDAAQLIAQAEAIFSELGDTLEGCRAACQRGHLELAERRDSRSVLARAETAAALLAVSPQSMLARDIERLRRAIEDFEAGLPLFRGERVEELPEGLRSWLAESGQL